MAMTAEQAQQLMEQLRAAQAQHTAMMEELDFSRQREHAATHAAVDRRAREVAEATARSGPPGIDTKLLGQPNGLHGENKKLFVLATVLRGPEQQCPSWMSLSTWSKQIDNHRTRTCC